MKLRKIRSEVTFPKGRELLSNPLLNKGTAFTKREREFFQLEGLLPPYILKIEEQIMRTLAAVRSKINDLEKYIYLTSLQDRNETLFYKMIMENIEEFMPIIYTPTVGLACQEFGHIYRKPRGLYISAENAGSIAKILCNWPHRDVDVIVVTDGERILGLGDLGADGMGIPIGKLSLYTACAGIHPGHTLPVTIDIGTNNEKLIDDPLYIGIRQKRMTGEEYDRFMDEFMAAAAIRFPGVLIQFEDFANHNAQRLLDRYKDKFCTFNDDIQGTAAVVLAGLFSAMRILKSDLTDHRFLFYGAGSAATGIAELIIRYLNKNGLSEDEAKSKIYLFDSRGLVTTNRRDLSVIKKPYAQNTENMNDFLQAVEKLRPTAIIGVSGNGGIFDQSILKSMATYNSQPIIFALSNPTSKSECTARQAYEWSDGRAIFASGSPFDPVTINGKTLVPGQGNNAYIFPGLGFGVVIAKPKKIEPDLFIIAAQTLAAMVSADDLAQGLLYPRLNKIREISLHIAEAVALEIFQSGQATIAEPKNLSKTIRASAFEPVYPEYV